MKHDDDEPPLNYGIKLTDSPWVRTKKLFLGMFTDKWWWFSIILGYIVGYLIKHM